MHTFAGAVKEGQATIDRTFEQVLRAPEECTEAYCPSGAYLVTGSDGSKLFELGSRIGGPQSTLQHGKTYEWTPSRYAILIGEGNYYMPGPFKLGYYTQVEGVGANKDTVVVSPGIDVLNNCEKVGDENCKDPGGLDNFWRSLSNVKLETAGLGKPLIYAISQASPLRDLTISGSDLLMCDPGLGGDCGFTSGGFISNVNLDREIILGSQQQFYVSDSQFSALQAGAWNVVSNNNDGGDYKGEGDGNVNNQWSGFPFSHTSTPDKYDVPKMQLEGSQWFVVADNQKESADDYVVLSLGENESPATVSADVISNINAKLSTSKGLVIAPGIYHLEGTIQVPNDRIVLGLGLPTLVCQDASGRCMETGSEGIRISGITFDAGVNGRTTDPSNVLLTIGNSGEGNNQNPVVLQDMYCRVARISKTQANPQAFACLEIKADNVVGENLWLWRADHDEQEAKIAFNSNECQHGLIVRGDNVRMHGLFVEHFNNYQTVWYGKNGQIAFYQSEMPYYLTVDERQITVDCRAPGSDKVDPLPVCQSLYVAEEATGFRGQGLGVYSFFPNFLGQQTVRAKSAIKVENEDVSFTHVLTYFLNGDLASGIDAILLDKYGNSYPSGSSVDGSKKGYAFDTWPQAQMVSE